MAELRRVVLDGEVVQVEVVDGRATLPGAPAGERVDAESLQHEIPSEPRTVVCVHLNYRSRLDELAYELPPAPTYFTKPTSCLNPHQGVVMRPANCRFLNYEGEFALVVGKVASRVSPEDAAEYIAGYTIANDFGLHDFRDTDANSMLRVKGTDTLGAVGPALVTDWDFRGKRISTRVNGVVVQEASTSDLIWDPYYLLADISRTITLHPGDLILTGTPSNSRPVEPGDVLEVEVEGLGILRSTIGETDAVVGAYGAQPSASENVMRVALAKRVDA